MRDEILESLEWFKPMQCPEAFNCIYVWRNKVNGKTYVGKAEKLHKRRNEHLRAKDDYYFHKSLRKRGVEGYQLAIIVKDVPTEELGDIETYYIKVLDSLSKNGKGYNDALGGNGGNTCAGKNEDEIREIRRKQSEVKSGENNPFYGKQHSEKTKEKMSEAMKGKNSGENSALFGCTGEKHPKSRTVICLNTGVTYGSTYEAERQTGVDRSSIGACCRSRYKSSGKDENGNKLVWMYLEDYEKLSEEEIDKIKNQEVPNNGRSKPVICVTTGKIYGSATEAERQTGVDRGNISNCCNRKLKSAGKDENGNKLVWKYLEEY